MQEIFCRRSSKSGQRDKADFMCSLHESYKKKALLGDVFDLPKHSTDLDDIFRSVHRNFRKFIFSPL